MQTRFGLSLLHLRRTRPDSVKLALSAHLRRDIGLPVFDHATYANARALAKLKGWM